MHGHARFLLQQCFVGRTFVDFQSFLDSSFNVIFLLCHVVLLLTASDVVIYVYEEKGNSYPDSQEQTFRGVAAELKHSLRIIKVPKASPDVLAPKVF